MKAQTCLDTHKVLMQWLSPDTAEMAQQVRQTQLTYYAVYVQVYGLYYEWGDVLDTSPVMPDMYSSCQQQATTAGSILTTIISSPFHISAHVNGHN